ncbi:MAG: signal peptidase I [Gammaproteobacteria bacterium]|nr:signal peptidase I [Gammaproteobacteria bacterium]
MMQTRTRRIMREVLVLGVLVVGILAARSTLADHYHVPSGSMEYTLMIGDRVFVDKRAFGLRVPFTNIKMTQGDSVERGDIVIFDSPRDGKRLIKRIVAVGGDTVEIQAGHLAINGESLAVVDQAGVERIGSKLVQLKLASGGGPNLSGMVEPGTVLAVGDHRGNSTDGRIFGAVPEREIYGRAVAVYYRRGDGFGWIGL